MLFRLKFWDKSQNLIYVEYMYDFYAIFSLQGFLRNIVLLPWKELNGSHSGLQSDSFIFVVV